MWIYVFILCVFSYIDYTWIGCKNRMRRKLLRLMIIQENEEEEKEGRGKRSFSLLSFSSDKSEREKKKKAPPISVSFGQCLIFYVNTFFHERKTSQNDFFLPTIFFLLPHFLLFHSSLLLYFLSGRNTWRERENGFSIQKILWLS